MVIPLEVDKVAFDKLPKDQQSFYKADGDKFKLDVEIDDNSGLKNSVESERTARRSAEKALKEFKKQFEGINPEAVREIMANFDSAEEAELLKQGAKGIETIVEKRMQKERDAFEEQIAELTEQVNGGLEVAGTFMDRVLDSHVMSAAAKAGVHPTAMDDVILRARSIFSVDDDGNAVQFEGEDEENQHVVMGRDGKNPYSPGEWVEEMKEKAPHWFPANSSGGGASGSGQRAGAGAKTMKRSVFETLSTPDKHAKMKEGVQIVD